MNHANLSKKYLFMINSLFVLFVYLFFYGLVLSRTLVLQDLIQAILLHFNPIIDEKYTDDESEENRSSSFGSYMPNNAFFFRWKSSVLTLTIFSNLIDGFTGLFCLK